MAPAKQGFYPDNLHAAGVYLGLVNNEEFFTLQCPAEVVLDEHAPRDAGIHLRFKEAVTIAPRFFGCIHGGISMFDQRV